MLQLAATASKFVIFDLLRFFYLQCAGMSIVYPCTNSFVSGFVIDYLSLWKSYRNVYLFHFDLSQPVVLFELKYFNVKHKFMSK
jgi:hypothetical protein